MKSLSVIVLALAGLAIAAPAQEVAETTEAGPANGDQTPGQPNRGGGDLTIEFYTEREYRGTADPVRVDDRDTKECKNVPRKVNNAIKSIRFRGSERFRCTFYTDRGCSGLNFSQRTNENIPTLDRDFKGDISSFMCEERRGGRDRDRGDRDRGDRDRGDRNGRQ